MTTKAKAHPPQKKRPRTFSFSRKRLKLAGLVAVFFLVVLSGVISGTASLLQSRFDEQAFRTEISQYVSAKTGYELILSGPLEIAVNLRNGVAVHLRDVKIVDPYDQSGKVIAHIERLVFSLDTSDVLRGRIRIVRVGVVDINLHLDDVANRLKNLSSRDAASFPPSYLATLFNRTRIYFYGGSVDIAAKTGDVFPFDVRQIEIDATPAYTRFSVDGKMSGVPIKADLWGGSFQRLTSLSWPFEVDMLIDTVRLAGRGRVRDGMSLVELRTFSAKMGHSAVDGDADIRFAEGKPSIEGYVRANTLNVSDLQNAFFSTEGVADPKLRGKSVAPMAFMRLADARLSFYAQNIVGQMGSVHGVEGKLSLANGALFVSPFTFYAGGGKGMLQARLDGRTNDAAMSLRLYAHGIDPAKFFNLENFASLISGTADIDADISSLGKTWDQILSNMNGNVRLVSTGGKIASSTIDTLGKGLADLIFPGASFLMGARLNCVAGSFAIADGNARTGAFLVDAGDVMLVGAGGFDLRNRTIDFFFRPFANGGNLTTLAPPFKITGTFDKRVLEVNPSQTFDKALALLTKGTVQDSLPPEMMASDAAKACLLGGAGPLVQKSSDHFLGTLWDEVKGVLGGLFGQILPSFNHSMLSE